MTEIPTNFKIPKKYARTFVFLTPKVRVVISTQDGSLLMGDMRRRGKKRMDDSMALDWIHETIEQIRWECGSKT